MFGRTRNFWQITVVIGLGLCLYAGYQWQQLPIPSDAELAVAVEKHYQEEVARMQEEAGGAPITLSPEWQEKFHLAIRAEQLRPVEDLKRPVYGYLALGLVTLVIGLGSFISQRLEKSAAGQKD